MFLSAEQIKEAVGVGDLIISDFSETQLKPVSYNFTLDSQLKDQTSGNAISIPADGYRLAPGGFVIGKTKEIVNLNHKYLCILSTSSSLAQQGIDTLQSSTIAEPDTNSQFVLEITNHGKHEVVLQAGMKIVKGIFSPVGEN